MHGSALRFSDPAKISLSFDKVYYRFLTVQHTARPANFTPTMGSKRAQPPSSKAALSFKSGNKLRRQDLHVKRKKALETSRRDERFRRKREEDQDPALRRERLARNIPHTIDKKRVWDEVEEDGLYASVDVDQLKRRRIEEAEEEESRKAEAALAEEEGEEEDEDDDADSMLEDSDSEAEAEAPKPLRKRASSIAASTTSTNLDLTPDSLSLKFPSLFNDTPRTPKVLLTTSLNSTLHEEAHLLCTLFPVGLSKFHVSTNRLKAVSNISSRTPHIFHDPLTDMAISSLCERLQSLLQIGTTHPLFC